MWNSVNIIAQCQPKFAIWENVKSVLFKKHKHNFDKYIAKLDELNYNSYFKVLNAKDYNIPQNRERIFVVSIRKDVDRGFEFPTPMELIKDLSVIIEQNVDERFNLTKGIVDRFLEKGINNNLNSISDNPRSREYTGFKNISPTLAARDYKDPKCIQFKTIIDSNDISKGIRKATPLEYFRLMGFKDEYFYKLKQNKVSNTQIYKQAGNSIVVNVIVEIYKKLKIMYPNDFCNNIKLISLFSGIGAFEEALRQLE